MTTIVKGIIEHGVVKLLENIDLPEAYPVEISIVLPPQQQALRMKAFTESAGILPELEADFATHVREESEARLKQKWGEPS